MRLPIVVLIVVITYCLILVPPGWSQSSSADTQQQSSSADTQQGTYSGAGMGAASAISTLLYFPFKAAFAIGGGIVGGLAYVFSGFSESTAKSIWSPSIMGDYIITPEHLSGDRPIRFLGVAAQNEGTTVAPAQTN